MTAIELRKRNAPPSASNNSRFECCSRDLPSLVPPAVLDLSGIIRQPFRYADIYIFLNRWESPVRVVCFARPANEDPRTCIKGCPWKPFPFRGPSKQEQNRLAIQATQNFS